MSAIQIPVIGDASAQNIAVHPSHDYNFSALKQGSFPVNRSWVTFHVINGSSGSVIEIENSSISNGLLVSTSTYGSTGDTYLEITVNTSSSFNIKMTFSWSYSNNLLYTGDIVRFGLSSTPYLGYEFGPNFGKNTHLIGSNSTDLGPDPSISGVHTLEVYGRENSDRVYTSIMTGTNASMHLPYSLQGASAPVDGHMNIFIGGGISNFTLYNLFVNATVSGFETPHYGNNINFSEKLLSINDLSGLDENLSYSPILDWPDNSFLYFSQTNGTKIEDFNYYNDTTYTLRSFSNTYFPVLSYSQNDSAWFIASNGSSSLLISYNFLSGKVLAFNLNHSFKDPLRFLQSGNSYYILDSGGGIFAVQEEDSSYSVQNISLQEGLTILDAWNESDGVRLLLYNGTSNQVSEMEINGSRETGLPVSYHLGGLDENVTVINGSGAVVGLPELQKPSSKIEYAPVFGKETFPLVVNDSNTYIPSAGNFVSFSSASGLYVFRNGTGQSTNIASSSQFVDLDWNLTHGYSISGSQLILYYTGSGPFSADALTLQFNPPGVLSGNVSLSYSLISPVNYSLTARIGSMELVPQGGYLNFSTEDLGNGSQTMELTARNVAGYSSTFYRNVSVDNYVPQVGTEPANGSYVPSGSSIQVRIGDLPGNISTTASFSGAQKLNFSGDDFNLSFPDVSSRVVLTLNVTDTYGISRVYMYTYFVESINYTGFHTNIPNGSYLPHHTFQLNWTELTGTSYYTVTVQSNSYTYSELTLVNSTKLDLPSGTYRMYLNSTLSGGAVKDLLQENFTVQAYNPGLKVKRSPGEYFSFLGNSVHNSLQINASSNVTSEFWLNLSTGDTPILHAHGHGMAFSFLLNSETANFSRNGNYTALLTAKEESGRETSTGFTFSVNNTIPAEPMTRDILYYNRTEAVIPVNWEPNDSYSYSYANGSYGGDLFLGNHTIVLDRFKTGLLVTGKDLWGNYNVSSLTLIYSSSRPKINFTLQPGQLIWSNVTHLDYTISDPVSITNVTLHINGKQIQLQPLASNRINLTLHGDGNYNVSISATDACGNQNNSSVLTAHSVYFPRISAIKPTYHTILGFLFLNSGISGKDLESVNVSWMMGGETISHQHSVSSYLLPGEHTVVLEVSYHGHTLVFRHNMLVLGFMPELVIALTAVSYYYYRTFHGSDDDTRAEQILIESAGKPRFEVFKIARREKVSRRAISRNLDRLCSVGTLSLQSDPDGVIYVMKSKEEGNKDRLT